mmetsp:Transcript_17078/g.20865  ORF Transcript_17078/g.20865 Transcript_17078/m.20865 type:complete len:108 (-) Transcript_17078:199-522(-)
MSPYGIYACDSLAGKYVDDIPSLNFNHCTEEQKKSAFFQTCHRKDKASLRRQLLLSAYHHNAIPFANAAFTYAPPSRRQHKFDHYQQAKLIRSTTLSNCYDDQRWRS